MSDTSPDKQGPFFFKHPFSQLAHEELQQAIKLHGEKSKVVFEERLNQLRQLLKAHNPLQTLTMLASYALSGTFDSSGEPRKAIETNEILQSQVELVQALALQMPSDDVTDAPLTPDQFQQLFSILPDLARAYANRRLCNMPTKGTAQDKSIAMIQERLRLHTQHARNWSYFHKVTATITALYEPLDESIGDFLGIDIKQIIKIFVTHLRLLEKKNTERVLMLQSLNSENTIEGMSKAYHKFLGESDAAANDFVTYLSNHSYDTEQALYLIWAHTDYVFLSHCFFDCEAIARDLSVSVERLKSLFDQLSLRFGSLADRTTEHLFLDNPVWLKTIIKIGDNEYFCALPQVFFSFIRPTIDSLLQSNPALMKACQDRRATYLEQSAEQLFQKAFPGCQTQRGFKWSEGGVEYESDLIVRVDTHLFLVEAKSGVISWPALRGAPSSARTHIKELIVKPSEQSERLERRLDLELKLPSPTLQGLTIDLSSVRNIIRLSVTLEDFATIQSTLHEMRATDWIPDSHRLAPCMLISDLEVILELLDSPGHRLNYLFRRYALSNTMITIGDELDHLGLYLGTGFNLGEVEEGKAILQLDQMSKSIDDYFVKISEEHQGVKPRPKLTKWWQDICSAVETRNFFQWSDVITILLGFSFEEQEQIETMFREMVARGLKSDEGQPQDTIFVTPPSRRSNAIAIYGFDNSAHADRHAKMQNVASTAFETDHVTRCLVIGINVERPSYPYGLLMVFNQPSEQSRP